MRNAFAVATVALLAACGAHPEARRVHADHVSLLVPNGWQAIDANTALERSDMQELVARNPQWASQLRLLLRPGTPLVLLAFSGSGERGSLSVYAYRPARPETANEFARRTLAALRLLPEFRAIARRERRIAGARGVELRYAVTYRARSRPVELHTLQIFLVRGGREYSVTYAGDPETFAARRSLFRRSISTLRIS